MKVNAIVTNTNNIAIKFFETDNYCVASDSVTGSTKTYHFSDNLIKENITVDIDSDYSTGEYVQFLTGRSADVFSDTLDFQKQYGLWDPNIRGFLKHENMLVKIGHLVEELAEIRKAYELEDINEFCDGILDLIYVAAGTLNLMNMPARELWNDIHLRNMNKIRATSGNTGKRGSTFDVIKPAGWTSPRTEDIIFATVKNGVL